MGVQENIELVRRFYDAGPADDDSARRSLFADDAVWHVPGDNPVSGDYVGLASILRDMPARMAPLDGWRLRVVDVLGNADLVVGMVHLTGERRGQTIDTPGAHVFRIGRDGRIAEAWGFTSDQARLDEFFRA